MYPLDASPPCLARRLEGEPSTIIACVLLDWHDDEKTCRGRVCGPAIHQYQITEYFVVFRD